MLAALRKLTDRLIGLSAFIGTAGLLFVVGVIILDVVGRNFGHPLYGSQDLITMTMVLIVFGGMALCDRVGGHIIVDIFEGSFPAALNRALDILSALLGSGIFMLIAYTVFQSARLSQMLNLSTNLLRLPTAWFQYALCAFAVITSVAMLLRAVMLARGQTCDTHPAKDMP
ncbi:TRAP transporter small permease [Paracoccus sp. R86501]|uniref:TRAP transporter small permease n=1 Tax=Paracoccus sp. R86501 TaxID=3101711 RepID=UPI00366D8CBF